MELIKQSKRGLLFLLTIIIGIVIYVCPIPDGIDQKSWALFSIFVSTIFGIIVRPMPMSVMAVFGLTTVMITKTLTFEQAFTGFNNSVLWLVILAFFIARGFIKSGLGQRIAFFFMTLLGKSTLGLGYGLVATDLLLSPATPSVTARVGGIIFPMMKSLIEAIRMSSKDHHLDKNVGIFLTQATFQSAAITSALFLTAMAANPLIVQLAGDAGVTITWSSWFLASCVPGVLSLLIVPFVLYKLYPPKTKKTPHAYEYAKKELAAMGRFTPSEWVMSGTFILLIILWILGPHIGLAPPATAALGLSILLLTGTLDWKEVLDEKSAWDTLFWFATLISMATFLNQFGLTTWFSNWIVGYIHGYNWIAGFIILSFLYFYTHYFFASSIAHIGAMYTPFLLVAIALGTPPYLAALLLAFYSNLFAALTQYASGPAPILFGAGYVSIGQWWKAGFIISLVNIAIWLLAGGAWWKVLGLW